MIIASYSLACANEIAGQARNDGKRPQFLELECEVQFGEGGERKGAAFGEVHGNRNYIEPQAQGQAVTGLRPPAPSYGRLQLKGT